VDPALTPARVKGGLDRTLAWYQQARVRSRPPLTRAGVSAGSTDPAGAFAAGDGSGIAAARRSAAATRSSHPAPARRRPGGDDRRELMKKLYRDRREVSTARATGPRPLCYNLAHCR